jgi:hypothetical protein
MRTKKIRYAMRQISTRRVRKKENNNLTLCHRVNKEIDNMGDIHPLERESERKIIIKRMADNRSGPNRSRPDCPTRLEHRR